MTASDIASGPEHNGGPTCPMCGGCWHRTQQCLDPRQDPTEWAMGAALGALVTGIILVTLGYVVPRDWQVDPNVEARKMETIERSYIRLNNALDGCTMAGMTLIAVGGLILATAVSVAICSGELIPLCDTSQDEEDTLVLTDQPVTAQPAPGSDATGTYGSTGTAASHKAE